MEPVAQPSADSDYSTLVVNNLNQKMPIQCELCKNFFSTHGNLYRHMRGTHNISPDPVRSFDFDTHSCKCLEGCNVSFISLSHLKKHLTDVHRIEFEEETYMFDNMEDFDMWLEYTSKTEMARYVKRRFKQKGKVYYYCNRSGKPQLAPEKSRKRKNRKGTSKINAYCTSVIHVSYNEATKKYFANFVKTHYGHDKDMKHLRLLKHDRLAIAEKLNSGLSTTDIIKEHRTKKNEDVRLTKSNVITGADVRNIRQSFKIYNNDNNGDPTAIHTSKLDTLLENLKKYEQLLECKKVGEFHPELEPKDLCIIFMTFSQRNLMKLHESKLICIDSTSGLGNCENDLTLITIFDNSGGAVPMALMFTNRRDLFINDYFIKKIKEKIGFNIQTNVFLGDLHGTFYKSWKSIMGVSKFQLFSPWQVSKAWKSNLKKISLEKASTIYEKLKAIQMNSNETEFHIMLEELVESMSEDEETEIFYEYFIKFFYVNLEKWGKFFYKKIGLDPELHLELLHEPVRSYVDDYNQPESLSYGIQYVLAYTKQRILNSTDVEENTIAEYLKDIGNMHAFTLKHSYVIECHDDEYRVSAETDRSVIHTVTEIQSGVCCSLVCSHCEICIHRFNCNCLNFILNVTICDHIHCVVQACCLNTDERNPAEEPRMECSRDAHQLGIPDTYLDIIDTNKFNEIDTLTLVREQIKVKCEEITENLDSLGDAGVLIQCLDYLKKANNLLHVKGAAGDGTFDEPDDVEKPENSNNDWGILIIGQSDFDHNYCN